MSLQGQRVTVMGLGLHGGAVGTVAWLHKQGAHIVVTDLRTREQLAATLENLAAYSDVEFVLGEHRDQDFTDTDMVIRNPAVPRTSPFLQKARAAGVPIEMDSSLFFKYCPSTHIIGVTGSKGKTTTTSAIFTLLKAVNPKTVIVGVEGTSPLGELEHITTDTPVVFELSSWRLEGLDEHQLSPNTAIVTSLYRDHLNTYASFEDYIEIKKSITKYQTKDGLVLLNADDALLQTWQPAMKARLFWYSANKLPENSQGIVIEDGVVRLYQDNQKRDLCLQSDLPLHSQHEQRNLLPAILLAHHAGASPEVLKQALATVKPLPHRLEVVRVKDAVTFINDSAATMPDATSAALQAFHTKSIVLIIGGSDKQLLFEELGKAVSKATIRALVWLPGTATEAMKRSITASSQYDVASMTEAVQKAAEAAQAGDVVLLSPGATSFGLFQHEFDRGNQFRSAVLALQ